MTPPSPAAPPDYLAQLLARLAAARDYPRAAQEARIQGVVLMLIYNYALSNGAEVMGEMALMSWVIAALAALFLAYALWMKRRGVLR